MLFRSRPEQVTLVVLTVTVNVVGFIIVAVPVSKQPLLSVTIKEYVCPGAGNPQSEVGLRVFGAFGGETDGLHTVLVYVPEPPVIVACIEPSQAPEQVGCVAAILTVNAGGATTVVVACDVQPLASVTKQV